MYLEQARCVGVCVRVYAGGYARSIMWVCVCGCGETGLTRMMGCWPEDKGFKIILISAFSIRFCKGWKTMLNPRKHRFDESRYLWCGTFYIYILATKWIRLVVEIKQKNKSHTLCLLHLRAHVIEWQRSWKVKLTMYEFSSRWHACHQFRDLWEQWIEMKMRSGHQALDFESGRWAARADWRSVESLP